MAILELEIHSYWHAGSGRGSGPQADAVVVRTPAGLPYLPGRTVKGLVRDAMLVAEAAGQVEQGRTAALFGQREPMEESEDKGLGRFSLEPGALRFSDARLGDTEQRRLAWESWAETEDGRAVAAELSTFLSSTKIDDRGQADKNTLRTIEVVVPLTLYAYVEPVDGADPGDWRSDLHKALPLLRAVGSKRSRGLGRCSARLLEEDAR